MLVFPLAAIVGSATSLIGYHARLGEGYLRTVDKTNLRGLAVPMEPEGLLADVAAGRDRFVLFGRSVPSVRATNFRRTSMSRH